MFSVTVFMILEYLQGNSAYFFKPSVTWFTSGLLVYVLLFFENCQHSISPYLYIYEFTISAI